MSKYISTPFLVYILVLPVPFLLVGIASFLITLSSYDTAVSALTFSGFFFIGGLFWDMILMEVNRDTKEPAVL